MNKQKIYVGIEDEQADFDRFIDVWHRASRGEDVKPEVHLNFDDFGLLISLLTPKRLELLKALRATGPISVRALSKHLGRDYKNVHVDCSELERVDLIGRNEDGLLIAPWDVIEAQFQLVA